VAPRSPDPLLNALTVSASKPPDAVESVLPPAVTLLVARWLLEKSALSAVRLAMVSVDASLPPAASLPLLANLANPESK